MATFQTCKHSLHRASGHINLYKFKGICKQYVVRIIHCNQTFQCHTPAHPPKKTIPWWTFEWMRRCDTPLRVEAHAAAKSTEVPAEQSWGCSNCRTIVFYPESVDILWKQNTMHRKWKSSLGVILHPDWYYSWFLQRGQSSLLGL